MSVQVTYSPCETTNASDVRMRQKHPNGGDRRRDFDELLMVLQRCRWEVKILQEIVFELRALPVK